MFQEERLYKILELLGERQSLTTNDIVKEFGVSRDTARRDIVKLSQEGSVLRTHGGITLPKKQRISEYYDLRINDMVEEKQRIAREAVRLIKPGQVCYFDASTTVLQLCYLVPGDIEVFSNSLNNVQVLEKRNCNVHIIGGKLNRENRFIYGYEAVEQISNVHYDVAFLGADGIGTDGLYSYKQEDAMIKKAVANMSDKIYVLTESSKFSEKRPYKCFSLNKVNGIITDKSPAKEQLEVIEKQGVKIIVS